MLLEDVTTIVGKDKLLFFSLRTMINYLSYVAVAYEHPRSHASAEHSDSINDGHCGHHLSEHGGAAHDHGWLLFLAAGW